MSAQQEENLHCGIALRIGNYIYEKYTMGNILSYEPRNRPLPNSHLKVLTRLHNWFGIILIFAALGGVFLDLPIDAPNLHEGLYFILAILFLIVGLMEFYSAICIAERRLRTFSVVMAAIDCLFVPVGTIIGIYTLMVLCRLEAVAQYREHLVVTQPDGTGSGECPRCGSVIQYCNFENGQSAFQCPVCGEAGTWTKLE